MEDPGTVEHHPNLLPYIATVAYDNYRTLRISVDRGIARATIDHPPINLLDLALIIELDRFSREVEADDSVRVVILDSADPEFFAAHADVTLIQALPTDDTTRHSKPSGFQAMVDRFRTMPKATIAVIEGIARGGGSELALSLRHAVRGDRPRESSPNPKSRSASFPAAAGRNDSTASSAAGARSRSCSDATTSTPRPPRTGAT